MSGEFRHIYVLTIDCRGQDEDVLAKLVDLGQSLRGELNQETGEFVGRRPGVTDVTVDTLVPRSDEQDPEIAIARTYLEVRHG